MRFFLVNPVATRFRITNGFNRPRPYANGLHEGIDLRAVEDSRPVAILAAQRGVVDRIRSYPSGYGTYVRLRHDWADGTTWVTWYAHLSSVEPGLEVGHYVQIGQRLGIAGTTGNSTGVHLHLTLQHLGYGLKGYIVPDVVDPTPFFSNIKFPDVDEAMPIADLTVATGSLLEASKPFTKVWRIRNTGTSTWTDGYCLAPRGINRLGGPDTIPLPPLQPGETTDLSVELVAPDTPGRHRAIWKGRNADGEFFPFEFPVDIRVTPVRIDSDAVFVDDVTVPDGMVVEPGLSFLKTWRIRNVGDTTWEAGYSLAFHSRKQMGGPDVVSLPHTLPGETADVSVALTAPAEPGTHRSYWRPMDPTGHFFGDTLFAEIKVEAVEDSEAFPISNGGDAAACVAGSTMCLRAAAGERLVTHWRLRNNGSSNWGAGYDLALISDVPLGAPRAIPLPPAPPGQTVDVSLALIAPSQAGHYQSSWQARNPEGRLFGEIMRIDMEVVRLGTADSMNYLADITIPDGAVISAGSTIQKTWRIKNDGNSAWVPGYALVFVGDEQMDAPDSVALPLALPGEEVEVTVPLTVPREPGLYRSTWRPRNLEGKMFGDIIFAELQVPQPGADDMPLSNATLDRHITIPAGATVPVGKRFIKTWAIRNTGSTIWTRHHALVFIGGDQMSGPTAVALRTTYPGDVARVSVELVAPTGTQKAMGRWRLRDPEGKLFGPTFFVSITITEDEETIDLLPYLRGDGRLYEMKHVFQVNGGLMIGQQRVQTQQEGDRFYIVKNHEWEELWADATFIYRGTDTSPGNGNFYSLMVDNRYGSPWVPRRMAVGRPFRRSPTVVSRRKRDCVVNFQLSGPHVTWIRLEAVHKRFVLPDSEGFPGRGITVSDVVVLAASSDIGGRPAAQPFERYYYAKGYGMVMWEGIDVDHKGKSFMVEAHAPGARPNNLRERITCLEPLIRRESAPALHPETAQAEQESLPGLPEPV